MSNMTTDTAIILRQPSAYDLQHSRMRVFMRWLQKNGYGHFVDYATLYQWSIENIDRFWATIWDYTRVRFSQDFDRVRGQPDMPGVEWFPGARLNFAENLLREAFEGDPTRTALIAHSEGGARNEMSYGELYANVGALAYFLQSCGLGTDDRVAGVVGNTPEALIGMLATTVIGAIWSSVSPDFGTNAIVDRFGQIEPKILISVDGYKYNGKSFDIHELADQLCARISSIEHVIRVPQCTETGALDNPGSTSWNRALATGHGHRPQFKQLPFEQPIYIVYSSGTTGQPKCIVHGAGGTLLQHSKELMLHCDLSPGDVLFYYTTTGWMMWNWLVSGLVTGATLVLYDGSPSHPDLNMLWALAEAETVTHFGTSARWIGGCRNTGVTPARWFDLESLRFIFSTGSPLLPEDFDYVYASVKTDLILASISGGTDILSCFVGGCPLLPVIRGEIQCKLLGMDVAAYDDHGHEVLDQRGELVCRQPAPCMPVKFWNDPGMHRYRAAYFETFPNVWAHGDTIEFNARGGAMILGRSDATLNPGGVRIGSAEIYRQVETLPEIADSLVVSQPWKDDERVVLMVVLNEAQKLSDDLIARIKERIREQASPRHVPAKIVSIDDVPYTRSGKKVEIAVANMLAGRAVDNREALANPESLDRISGISTLFK